MSACNFSCGISTNSTTAFVVCMCISWVHLGCLNISLLYLQSILRFLHKIGTYSPSLRGAQLTGAATLCISIVWLSEHLSIPQLVHMSILVTETMLSLVLNLWILVLGYQINTVIGEANSIQFRTFGSDILHICECHAIQTFTWELSRIMTIIYSPVEIPYCQLTNQESRILAIHRPGNQLKVLQRPKWNPP